MDDEKGWLRRVYLQQRKLARFDKKEHFKEHSRIVFESISNSSSKRLCETKILLGHAWGLGPRQTSRLVDDALFGSKNDVRREPIEKTSKRPAQG